ncbi:MAG: type II toxin-antitoxin system HicA family toxin [Proteobacteria bacterium]|nr:type II toxin-antitoxin system HicA family toxin [Pseudomonadota bacterium]
MKGSELYRSIKKLGKGTNTEVYLEKRRGKGSHQMLYYGDNRVILKDLKKEIGPGLLKAILDALGIDRNELP